MSITVPTNVIASGKLLKTTRPISIDQIMMLYENGASNDAEANIKARITRYCPKPLKTPRRIRIVH